MQPNKTYVASDGYEYFMCPMTEFKITQVENVGTHLGTYAVDFASGTAGYRAPYYAPATVKCIKTIPSYGEATWQTVNKVHCPNGYFGIVTFETVHDNTFNAYVGMVIKQGQQLGNMGDAGRASGVHLHIEFTQSANSSMGYNSYGVYTFNAVESYVDDTMFVDDTNIIDGKAGNWRKTSSSNSGSSSFNVSQLIQEDGIATMTVDAVQARLNSPTGAVVRKYNTGDEIRYYWKWVGNGHRYIVWKEGSNYILLAVSGTEKQGEEPWATFRAPDETPSEPEEPETPETPEEPAKEFPDSVKYKGIDISQWNGDVDVSGQEFVIIRAAFGTNTDETFLNNVEKCRKANIPFGVYLYDYALNDDQALEQPTYLHNLLKKHDIVPDLGVWFDLEDADGYKNKNGVLNKERCTKNCKVFCDYFKERGYYVGIYSSTSWFENMIDETGYPKWIANWGPVDNGTCQGDFSDQGVMHQYTSIPLDKDVMYVEMDVMKSNPIEVEEPEDKPEVPAFPELDVDAINSFYRNWAKIAERILG